MVSKKKNYEGACDNCGVEFQVKSNSKEPVAFCPFCGEDIAPEEIKKKGFVEEDEDYEDEDEE